MRMRLVALATQNPAGMTNASKLIELVVKWRTDIGFTHVSHYCKIAQELDNEEVIVATTYDSNWLAEYLENNYFRTDPILTKGMRGNDFYEPFQDAMVSPEERQVLERSKSAGLGEYAICIPSRLSRRHAGITTIFFRHKVGLSHRRKLRLREFNSEFVGVLLESVGFPLPKKDLTDREIGILQKAAQGMTDAQIGVDLGISRWTVVAHFQAIKHKLGVANRAAAVAWAVTNRIAYVTIAT